MLPYPYPHRCVREINDCFAECTPLNTWLFFRIPLRGRPRESLQTTGRRLMPLPLQQKLALNLFMETDLSLARRETGGKENWKEKLETKIPGLNSSVRTSWATVWLRTRWGGGCEKVEKVPCSVRMMIKSYFFKWQNGISIEILFLQMTNPQRTWAPKPRVWVWDKGEVGALNMQL